MDNGSIKTWLNNANNNSKIPELIFGLLVFGLGITVRVNFVAGSQYPLNDGGFFYRMTEELVSNNFLLPKYSLYNHSDIPFAYPPLAFYLIGITNYLSGISLLSLFKYFPLVVSSLSIPVFYMLTERIFEEKTYRLLAVYIFATLPRSFEWFVMGGGATRSLGLFFAMLSLYFLWSSFQENKFSLKVVWGAIFSALTVLSHPVTSLFLVFSVVVIIIYHFPVDIKILISMAGLILITTSAWWGTVFFYHGFSPFIGASNTGHTNWLELKNLITLNYDYENPYFLAIVSILAILGMFSKRKKLHWTLGILCVLGYIVMPRGGVDLLTVYLSMLATIGFQVVTKAWNNSSKFKDKNNYPEELKSQRTRYLLGFLFIYLFLGAYTYKYVFNKSELRLNESNVLAMEWLRENVKESDAFLLIPPSEDNRYWWNDYISEWFPALSERESITTVQGYEWKPEVFAERVLLYTSLRSCSLDYNCIKEWQKEYKMNSDFIYFDDLKKHDKLSGDFLNSGSYRIIFENEKVMILRTVDQ